MSTPFPEPTGPAAPRAEVLLAYLEHFRSAVLDTALGLGEEQLRRSLLPSGWTVLELARHLTHVERRWLVWGFEGTPVDDPWADSRDGRWHVGAGEPAADVLEALSGQGAVTASVVRAHDLAEVGRPGERWDGADPPTLERVLLHLLQEYARHAGHLDVVRELLDDRRARPVFVEPVTLTGDLVQLEPLVRSDSAALAEAAADGRLWTLQYTSVPHPEQMPAAVEALLAEREAGRMVPFTVRRRDSGRVIGMTTYCNLDPDHRRLEIGYTWNARSAQRSGTNTESKLLLLGHAFDALGCIAVEFRTHWLNQQSRRAIERLGARQDGVLRSHRVSPDGTLRDTVVYSVLAHEWPAMRNELRRRLAAAGPPS